jgi:NAD(P)-dependent dehydrogenase (short-subunit alcohol dehydrogenase family)
MTLLRNVIVTGASRGLGLEIVNQLASRSSCQRVVASCRNPDQAEDLLKFKEKYPEKIFIRKLDVNNIEKFPDFIADLEVKHILKSNALL